jgi:hypothetical protein
MKTIMGILLVVFALTMGTGCAPAKKIWISSPAIQNAGNDYYDAKLEPLTKAHDFFVSFLLSITNKTDKNLEIDWNKTRYILRGRSYGVFVFKGINPEDIKNATIAPDVISAGKTFSRVISPYKLLARAPIRDRGKTASEAGIHPGILPNGENGILLVVRQNGKEIVEKMMVIIEEKKVQ